MSETFDEATSHVLDCHAKAMQKVAGERSRRAT